MSTNNIRSSLNLIIKISLILLLLFNFTFTPLSPVYAKEGDEGESTEESKETEDGEGEEGEGNDENSSGSGGSTSSGSANVFESIDSTRKQIVLNRLKYDMRLHYIITYAILNDDYMADGHYSNLVNRGTFPEGFNEGINMAQFTTGATNIITTTELSSNASEMKDDKETQENLANSDKLRGELVEKMMKKYSNRILEIYLQTQYSNTNTQFFKTIGSNSVILNISYHEDTDVKLSELKGTPIYESIESAINKKVESFFKGLSSDDLLKIMKKEFTADNLEKKIFLSDSDYRVLYSNNIPSSANNKEVNKALKTTSTKIQATYSFKGDATKEIKVYSYLFPGMRTSWLKDKNSGKDSSESLLSARMSKNSALKAKVDKLFADLQVDTDLGEFYSQNLKDIEDLDKAINNETIKGIGWLPLRLKYGKDLEELENGWFKDSEFRKVIEYFDGGVISEEGIVEVADKSKYRGFRLLQVNDLINIPIKKSSTGVKTKHLKASPYLTFEWAKWIKEKDVNKQLKVEYGDILFTNDIIKYTGIRYDENEPDAVTDYVVNLFKSKKEKIGHTKSAQISDLTDLNRNSHRIFTLANADGKRTEGLTKLGDMTMGIDSYGNIISSETMKVMIPYWANTNIYGMDIYLKNGKEFLTIPAMKKLTSNDEKSSAFSKKINSSELSVKLNQKDLEDIGEITTLNELQSILTSLDAERNNIETYLGVLSGERKSKQAVALALTQETSGVLKAFNAQFLNNAEEEGELYVTPSDAGALSGNDEEDALEKFNALELLEKIKLILDIGFYELIRLTVASWVVTFYTSAVSNFSMANIFHTELIVDTPMWSEMLTSIALLLVGFTGLYIAIMAIKIMRQTATVKDLGKTLFNLMLVLLIPTVIYSPLVNLVVNKPAQLILNKQMEQVSMVDSFINVQNEVSEVDPLYSKLFGHKNNVVDKESEYLIDFYTTEHVKGFDILDYNPERDSRLTQLLRNNLKQDSEWGKNELVKVRVNMFDLFEWVQEENAPPLFTWLSSAKGSNYKGVENYKEYSFNTSLSYKELDFEFVGKEWKASEIFRTIYSNMETQQVQNNISGLYNLTSAFRTRATADNSGGLSNTEREILIRDLAFASSVRKDIYGSEQDVSSKTKEIFDKYSISKDTINLRKDFLGLEEIIPQFKPYRNITTTTLAGDVFDVNKAILDDYILNLSIVRESANSDEGMYTKAEYPMVVMRTWFELNKLLGNKFMPTSYGVDTITFDTYMRLLYIPLGQYFQVDTPDIKNVSEYLALREHPLTLLFLFLPMILSLMVYGLLYVAVFYVLLMLMQMATFIYNNIIKSNPDNKALLGSMMILITFGMSKFGLVVIWSLFATLLNYMYASTGTVSYPVTLVHTLVVLVYVILNLIFIWKFVILNVLKDKGNLGGQAMMDSIKSFTGKIQAKFNGVMGVNPLSSAMPGSYDAHRMREGSNARLNSKTNTFNSTTLSNKGVKDAVMNSRASGIANNLAQSLKGSTVNAYHNVSDSMYKVTNKDGKEEHISRNTADLLIDSNSDDRTMEVNRKMLNKYDKIQPTENVGLSNEEVQVLEANSSYGMDLTKQSENYTVMDTENEQSAKIMADYLRNEKGLDATVDGANVIFNHDEYDLQTAEGRKALFGGVVQNSAKALASIQTDYNIEQDSNALSYTTNKEGQVEVKVGNDGISKNSLDEILENPSIAENFVVSEMPAMTANGYANGSVVLTPKSKNVEIHDEMENVFNLDSTLRKKNNEKVRTKSELDTMVDIGLANKEVLQNVSETKLKGMSIQNGKLYYDSNDKRHTEYAENLVNELNQEVNETKAVHKDLAVKVASHVTHGEGSGLQTKVYNSQDIQKDKKLVNQFREYGHDVMKPTEKMSYFGGKHSETINKRINDAIVYNQLDKEVSDKLSHTQREISNKGFEVIKQASKRDENMSHVAQNKATINRLTTLAEQNNMKKDVVKDTRKELKAIEKQRKSNNITESEYENKMYNLLKKTNDKLSTDDKYVDVMSNVLRDSVSRGRVDKKSSEEIKKVLNTYVDVSRELAKHGVEDIGSSVQMYNDLNLDKHGIDFTKVKNVQVSQDGKVHVETDGTIDKQALDSFIMDISKSVASVEEGV